MYFVSRWREPHPHSKRVVELSDVGVLEWFQRGWGREDSDEMIESELGGEVYGLDSIFDAARAKGLPRPETLDELRELLHDGEPLPGDVDGTAPTFAPRRPGAAGGRLGSGGVGGSGDEGEPYDVQLLRILLGDDEGIGAALQRYSPLTGYDPSPEEAAPTASPRTVVRIDPHLIQVARHIDEFFGYDQWFLFDTTWAASHPDLARSLLRYAAHWDPFAD